MLVQLLLTGYLLKHLFAGEYPALISPVIMVMLTLPSWISSRGLEHRSWRLYLLALVSAGVYLNLQGMYHPIGPGAGTIS
jgi:ABC-type iron transport system FetAB permease component